MRPTRNRPGLIASIVIALLAVAWSACTTDSPTPTATASPPPNPTTLSGISVSDSELMVVEGEAATIVVTLNSDPGEDIEVRLRLDETGSDDITLIPDRVSWTATDWQQPREVALTAIFDRVTERVETHELRVWTYVRDQTGPAQQILAKETIQVTLADSRGLVTLTGDSEDEIVLEWIPSDQRTHRWQYRYRRNDERTWGAWADVPHSDANPRSLRVTGLTPGPEWGYYFQVRPRPASAGAVSEVVLGVTGAWFGSDGIPMPSHGFFLERGGKFRFSSSAFTFVVPHGMLLMMSGEGGPADGGVVILDNLSDQATGAYITVDTRTGEVLRKTFWDAATNSYQLIWLPTGEIVGSWEGLPPPPGHDLHALWDELEQSIRKELP